ncbi:hypothetical protein pipiens_000178, partial [Culex pipiens pipiens]
RRTYDHNGDSLPHRVPAGSVLRAGAADPRRVHPAGESVDVLELSGGGGHRAAAVPGQQNGRGESIASHYLFALGSYRALYLLNWICRYYAEGHYDLIAIFAGAIQTILYCDFFYLYITKVLKGKKLQLPA